MPSNRYISMKLFLLVLLFLFPSLSWAEDVPWRHGFSLHEDLKYDEDFTHFEYVNPEAPKGGEIRLAGIGTFDSLNPFILRGTAPLGLGMIFETLTVQSQDEPFSEYGLIAESIQIPDDHSWVAFALRPEARFHDGSPITVDDVIFTLQILQTQGHPFYRAYYANVVSAEEVGPGEVRFNFGDSMNRELPLIVGQMPVLSKAYWQDREFDRTTLDIPLGSGPYRIARVDAGRSITYERVEDYWAADLPVNKGRHNFDRYRYEYYRDVNVALEAFKAGQYDFRQENVARLWASGYEGPALRQGRIIMEEIPHELPTGMQGFVFNTRRPAFRDPLVREALTEVFDFEWSNQNLFHGAYTRTRSYFSNSELASKGLPSPEELELLEPHRDRLPERIFTAEFQPPETDGTGNIRPNIRRALALLAEAGWSVSERDRQLRHSTTGELMEFEILLDSPTFERVCLPYVRNLERLGIAARVRTVDATQYQNRMNDFDFDMTVGLFPQSLSPGNEQRDFWTSESAATPGSRNIAGVRDQAVDELVDLIIAAPDRDSLISRTRALDRILLWNHYVVPHWHSRVFRVAYWDKFARPEISPKYGLPVDAWWVK
ncbi:microcin C transport system substrate-binding protein [Desulfonatronum thiosulfatophilum]|uniref:Microcin C transport system substrate-binding protein n=2 Tax=Desulfonatronum thiosulfatophilum TaxID=617002 RepID=A0A1G6B823_9BACT|nr:microcin C transport system substrate-binding protein [Desulfonatronum thiosulfatophilum]